MPTTPTSQDVQALFDRIAPVYDQLNDRFSLGQHKIWKQMAVKWSQPTAGATYLDLCCGSGDLAQLLARQLGPTGTIFAVDFSPQQLAIARQRWQPAARTAPIHWVEGDALQIPFDEETFQGVTMGYGLRNVVDIPACLQEIYRVLVPGGRAAILDFHRPTNQWVKQFQSWYLQTVVVPLAQSLGLREEYAYLQPSLDRFPSGTEQVELAQQAGFAQATHYPIAGGTMGVLVLQKAAFR